MSESTTPITTSREYHQWVANETLEDFALRYTSNRARKWSFWSIANTALGTASFLVLELLGGTIAANYGFTNSLWAIVAVCGFLFLSGLPISYYAAKYGVDVDLLTRGAGFGYIGSTISSLIYASFTFIFFALEAAIMARALHLLFNIALPIGYLLSTLVVIPLVTHGITMISRFQRWTQPIWIALQLLPVLYIGYYHVDAFKEWTQFPGIHRTTDAPFNFLLFGAAASVLLSLVAQIGEQVDFLRFLPKPEKHQRWQWWAAVIAAGPGWTIIGMFKLLLGSFLAYLLLQQGKEIELATDPTHMYTLAFSYITHTPELAMVIAALFVIICQIKINVANAYAGSLAWSNFFSRLTHHHPGRVVWLFFNMAIALMLMELGVYRALEQVLQHYSVIVLAWFGAIVADLVINKPLKLSPNYIEFKRSHLYDINPVGVVSMLVASVIGFCASLGWLGEVAEAMASFLAFFIPFVTAPAIAVITKSRFYLARTDEVIVTDKEYIECVVCQNTFDAEDMSQCPAHGEHICSLCCSLDTNCQDQCRPKAHISHQVNQFLITLLPKNIAKRLSGPLGKFLLFSCCISLLVLAIMALTFSQLPSTIEQSIYALFFNAQVTIFFLLVIVIGIVVWLFVLAQYSQQLAVKEAHLKTQLLTKEILAHEQTHLKLEEARYSADSANNAKSRYVTSLSHELRTPLNVILGYAQLLENDTSLPNKKQEVLSIVRRNGEHLATMIEGLLEISKIEVGRLSLNEGQVRLDLMLDQLTNMFNQQAKDKGLWFNYKRDNNVPACITVDEKRLRQILINLLSNAIKFTVSGGVTFSVIYRGHVIRFIVSDTGVGIPDQSLETLFNPFHRVENPLTKDVSGSGLGLAISRSLANIMGAEIEVESTLNKGSTFTLYLHATPIDYANNEIMDERTPIIAYDGDKKTVLAVDDNDDHGQLIKDLLTPLGFEVKNAVNADTCYQLMNNYSIDLVLLDIALPEIDGWTIAKQLRHTGYRNPIIMVSANARGFHTENTVHYHDDYLEKPIQLDALLEKIGALLGLQWCYENGINDDAMETFLQQDHSKPAQIDDSIVLKIETLKKYASIGHINGFIEVLDELENGEHLAPQIIMELRACAKSYNLSKVEGILTL